MDVAGISAVAMTADSGDHRLVAVNSVHVVWRGLRYASYQTRHFLVGTVLCWWKGE